MLRRFSPTHVTAMVIAAMMVPSSLYAVSAFSSVVIIDPNSGAKANVSSDGQIAVTGADPFARYKNNPDYSIELVFSPNSNTCPLYTVPSGFELVLTAMTGSASNAGSGGGFYLRDGCSGGSIAGAFTTVNAYEPLAQNFGSGITLRSGSQIGVFNVGAGNAGVFLHGYLVPTSAFTAGKRPSIEHRVAAVSRGPRGQSSPP